MPTHAMKRHEWGTRDCALPFCLGLCGVVCAVSGGDVVGGSRDHARGVGGKKDDDRRYVCGIDPWDAERGLCLEGCFRGFFIFLNIAGWGLAANFEGLSVAFLMPGQRCVDQTRYQGVDGNAVLAEFERGRLHESDDAPFRCGIGGPASMSSQ